MELLHMVNRTPAKHLHVAVRPLLACRCSVVTIVRSTQREVRRLTGALKCMYIYRAHVHSAEKIHSCHVFVYNGVLEIGNVLPGAAEEQMCLVFEMYSYTFTIVQNQN